MTEELEAILRAVNARSSLTWSLHNLAGDLFVDADGALDVSVSISLDPRDDGHDWVLWKHVAGSMAAMEGPYSYELETGHAPSIEDAQAAAEQAMQRFLEGGEE